MTSEYFFSISATFILTCEAESHPEVGFLGTSVKSSQSLEGIAVEYCFKTSELSGHAD